MTDWPRFWSQLEAEIDRAEVPDVTKYSYLKELVDPKIRKEIDGLPFSSDLFFNFFNFTTTFQNTIITKSAEIKFGTLYLLFQTKILWGNNNKSNLYLKWSTEYCTVPI